MDKGFSGCPRVRARKNKKNYKKTGVKNSRLWATGCCGLQASRPPPRAAPRQGVAPPDPRGWLRLPPLRPERPATAPPSISFQENGVASPLNGPRRRGKAEGDSAGADWP
jgi:hypothetical protein